MIPSLETPFEFVDQGDSVFFVTRRQCIEGEELYLDYGRDYDRSFYGKADAVPEPVPEAAASVGARGGDPKVGSQGRLPE